MKFTTLTELQTTESTQNTAMFTATGMKLYPLYNGVQHLYIRTQWQVVMQQWWKKLQLDTALNCKEQLQN